MVEAEPDRSNQTVPFAETCHRITVPDWPVKTSGAGTVPLQIVCEAEIEPGIVYIPPLTRTHITNGRSEQLQRILNTDNGYVQAMLLLTEVLCRTQISIDNQTGIRLLHLMNQLMPELIFPNIRLGIYSIGDRSLEGLVYLHRARELALDHPVILQALYLAYRDLEQAQSASYWHQIGLDYGKQRLAKLPWQWTNLSIERPQERSMY